MLSSNQDSMLEFEVPLEQTLDLRQVLEGGGAELHPGRCAAVDLKVSGYCESARRLDGPSHRSTDRSGTGLACSVITPDERSPVFAGQAEVELARRHEQVAHREEEAAVVEERLRAWNEHLRTWEGKLETRERWVEFAARMAAQHMEEAKVGLPRGSRDADT